ncbi:TetR/AcrR family transcriptional regulator [Cochlodiniinecator piscidefendens]|uniref:TetR/AcrR family transcriptional regulator n=1 Tax=Cochlodiniinecator piscidefendens TaxID=2715756 RepID=UPI00140DE8C3|nr:TetR/AcrR family transcriptional regulator [Cochlodiniinecator piscidefendens]
MNPTTVLSAFQWSGYQNTSFEDLGAVIGVDAHTLEKEFGDKKSLLEWAMKSSVEAMYQSAIASLFDETHPPFERLKGAFNIWVGETMPSTAPTAESEEVMAVAMSLAQTDGFDPSVEFAEQLAQFLLSLGLVGRIGVAREKAFLLLMAAKGLLMTSQSKEIFSAGFERCILAAFPKIMRKH